MANNTKPHLIEALRDRLVVRYWNPYDEGSNYGYVLDIGPRFFLLAFIDDNLKFNGFQCVLIADVRRLQVPAKYADFAAAALRKRKQLIRKKPEIDLGGLPEMLVSANRLFPLITIHRERVTPDTCKIGRVVEVDKTHLRLREIGPDAVWETRATRVNLTDITRVEFGGGYEEALYLVGGPPKNSEKPVRSKLQ